MILMLTQDSGLCTHKVSVLHCFLVMQNCKRQHLLLSEAEGISFQRVLIKVLPTPFLPPLTTSYWVLYKNILICPASPAVFISDLLLCCYTPGPALLSSSLT